MVTNDDMMLSCDCPFRLAVVIGYADLTFLSDDGTHFRLGRAISQDDLTFRCDDITSFSIQNDERRDS